jgi:alpha-L-fucosidase
MKKLKISLFLFTLFIFINTNAQNTFVHEQSSEYEWPTDSKVLNKLDKWQDLKFGVILHWGLYSVPGIVESWALCSEDWITRYGHNNYQEFKNWYWGFSNTFNPTKFDPTQWANTMKKAGMKYVVFTTKHHEGFCMFDSKYTDFSIAKGPFKNNPKADVAKYVFNAFRKDGFMIGAYFSKPDWHSQYYWWDKYDTPNRNVNYTIENHPWRWKKFKEYTYNQIDELMSRYGSIDILWLDGGWVAPENKGQDIDLPKIATMARSKQPGLLIVDRTIPGKYENYQTPEQAIPATQLSHPWESCMSLSHAWGWVEKKNLKSAQKVISTLIEVVAKGGNLLLGVGPTPEGQIEPSVTTRLQEIGDWMKINGKAIYGTRTTPNYQSGKVWFTADKDKKTLYALYALTDGEKVPSVIEWDKNIPAKGTVIRLLATGKPVAYSIKNGKVIIRLPRNISKIQSPAFAFRIH